MAAQRKTWFAILGLLDWRPMSGYDIKKLVEMGLSHFWSESYGSLYPTLGQLVEAGLARRRSERRGERVRHAFSITARGRRELRAWLNGPTEPPAVRNELLLKLFLAPGRAPADTRRLLSAYREGALKRLEDYAASEQVLRRSLEEGVPPPELRELLADEPGRPTSRRLAAFLLTLRHGVLATEARLAWCEEALALLGQQRRGGKGARS